MNPFMVVVGWLTRVGTFFGAANNIIGFFGYIIAFYSFLRQHATRKASEATINALVTSIKQQSSVAVAAAPPPIRTTGYAAPPSQAGPAPAPLSHPVEQEALSLIQSGAAYKEGPTGVEQQLTQVTLNRRNLWRAFVAGLNHPTFFWVGSIIQTLYLGGFIGGFILIGENPDSAGGTFGILVATLAYGVGLGYIVAGIVSAIRLKRWGWVIGIFASLIFTLFILPFLGLILYGLNGPTTKRVPQSTTNASTQP